MKNAHETRTRPLCGTTVSHYGAAGHCALCTNAPSIRRGKGAGPGAWPGPGDRAGSRAGFLSYICSAVVS